MFTASNLFEFLHFPIQPVKHILIQMQDYFLGSDAHEFMRETADGDATDDCLLREVTHLHLLQQVYNRDDQFAPGVTLQPEFSRDRSLRCHLLQLTISSILFILILQPVWIVQYIPCVHRCELRF